MSIIGILISVTKVFRGFKYNNNNLIIVKYFYGNIKSLSIQIFFVVVDIHPHFGMKKKKKIMINIKEKKINCYVSKSDYM